MEYSGSDGITAFPSPGLTMNFLDNFYSVFVSSIFQWNHKIRVPRLLLTVRVFSLLKTYHFWDFSEEGAQSPPLTPPYPIPVTEILNTPLTEYHNTHVFGDFIIVYVFMIQYDAKY